LQQTLCLLSFTLQSRCLACQLQQGSAVFDDDHIHHITKLAKMLTNLSPEESKPPLLAQRDVATQESGCFSIHAFMMVFLLAGT
jgi:hypothetical protein